MNNKEMNERINKIINDFLFPLEKHENNKSDLIATSILLRGFVTCNNDEVEKSSFLLTGINPSFNRGQKYFPKDFDNPFTFRNATSNATKPSDFWFKKKKQFKELCNIMAYLDLFPIRETDQGIFKQAFAPFNEFMSEILAVTQEAIEIMHPRLIVHANKDSMRYWGSQGDWMGYDLTQVTPEMYRDYFPSCMKRDNRWELFPLYQIKGFQKFNDKRINRIKYPDGTSSSLCGSFLMGYVMDDRYKKYKGKLYEYEDWKEIWEWVKDHTPSPEQ